MYRKQKIFLCGLLALLPLTSSARILAVFPVASKSQFYFNEAVMKSLHAAGHQITFISPFSSEKQIENYTTIDSRIEKFVLGRMSLEHMTDISLNDFLNLNTQICGTYCCDMMKLKKMQEILNSRTKLYDIMFIGLIPLYQCYLPIAQKLGISVIGTIATRSFKLADAAVGFPNHPAIIPLEFIDSKPAMTFAERMKNLWGHLVTDYYTYFVFPIKINQFYEKFNVDSELRYGNKVSLVFYNSHASLLPRPVVPNAIELGGIHLKPARALPPDLQKFVDEAEHGVILFTFGSVLKASTMPAELKSVFVRAFAAIPQRVIWKYDEPIEGISDNVLLSSWVPQFDILSHKNVKAFISHCGLSGMYESVYAGTPVITTPLFVDQYSNAALLEKLGVALRLDVKTATTEKVLEVLNTIINNTGFYERMQNLSRVFKDRPMTPQESAVYWTEYVIRHNGASHLQAVGSQMPLHQYLLLDIVLLISVFLIVALSVLFYVLKKFDSVIIKRFARISVAKKKKTH